jgi:hypothetical protein
MNPRARGRVTACTPSEARGRREQARAFLDVADLVLVEPAARAETHVATWTTRPCQPNCAGSSASRTPSTTLPGWSPPSTPRPWSAKPGPWSKPPNDSDQTGGARLGRLYPDHPATWWIRQFDYL